MIFEDVAEMRLLPFRVPPGVVHPDMIFVEPCLSHLKIRLVCVDRGTSFKALSRAKQIWLHIKFVSGVT
jgi:hypothetical protein